MRSGGRISAAIEILTEIFTRHRPASEALKDWGKAHRFAGSGDRHVIGTLVFDALRKRNSLAHRMGTDAPRALALAAVAQVWRRPLDELATWSAEPHGFDPLTEMERAALSAPADANPPDWVRGDYPEWLAPDFAAVFGEHAADEGAALSERAPIDLRVNTLKANSAQVLEALAKFGAAPGPLSPHSVRLPAPGPEGRHANAEAEPGHGLGWYEVQDSASQVAALMAGAESGEQVADICAGAGGKTLALAAAMENGGRIVAHDSDRFRLRPIFERIGRSGASNIEVIAADEPQKLDAMAGSFDCVLIDAPCSGSGAWRRKPDAKWRLTERALAQRIKDQDAVLRRGARLVKPGGRLIYVTCSVLPAENGARIAAFLKEEPAFSTLPYTEQWRGSLGTEPPPSASATGGALLLTPRRHGTDGFFIAALTRGS